MGKDLIYLMTDLVVWANRHLKDTINIPPRKKDLIENDPGQLIRLTLQALDEWEKQFLPWQSFILHTLNGNVAETGGLSLGSCLFF